MYVMYKGYINVIKSKVKFVKAQAQFIAFINYTGPQKKWSVLEY